MTNTRMMELRKRCYARCRSSLGNLQTRRPRPTASSSHGFCKANHVSFITDVSVETSLGPIQPLRILINQGNLCQSKFLSDPAAFIPDVRTPNRDSLDTSVVKSEFDRGLLHRLRRKTTVCT